MQDHTHPIFLLAGAPAAGKSTTSRALAARFPQSIHLPVDDFRTMVVSGLALPSDLPSHDLLQQITLARTCAIHVAFTYRSAGFMVVIDDFFDPNFHLDYRPLLTHPNVHRVVLYPDQAAAHQRNVQRSGVSDTSAYIDIGIRIVYDQIRASMPQLVEDNWHILDTTTLSVEQAVTTILQQTAPGG